MFTRLGHRVNTLDVDLAPAFAVQALRISGCQVNTRWTRTPPLLRMTGVRVHRVLYIKARRRAEERRREEGSGRTLDAPVSQHDRLERSEAEVRKLVMVALGGGLVLVGIVVALMVTPAAAARPCATSALRPCFVLAHSDMECQVGAATSSGSWFRKGSRYGIIFDLRNAGSSSCTIHGYPRVWAWKPAWNHLAISRDSVRGALGGLAKRRHEPPLVTLAPNAWASFLVEGRSGGKDARCTDIYGIRVAFPGTRIDESFPLWPQAFPGCGELIVHPYLSGRDAGMIPSILG